MHEQKSKTYTVDIFFDVHWVACFFTKLNFSNGNG